MSHRRFSIFAALSVCLAASSAAWARATEAISRFVDFALSVLSYSRPGPRVRGWDFAAVSGPSFYEAPPAHFLRHEAGTPQRGAHRNI